jgi:hypothetical protein
MYDIMWSGLLNRVPRGGSGVKVMAVINYEQRTQLYFIDGNLNTQKYCDEILRPISVTNRFISVFSVI